MKNSSFLGFALLVTVFFQMGCATEPEAPEPKRYACDGNYYVVDFVKADRALDTLSQFFEKRCFQNAIEVGLSIRQLHRDKTYHMTAELGEILVPEGTLTTYVLESYERIYLSILLAASFDGIHDRENAEIELRRAYEESVALIYNQGVDSTTLALQAALWENFGHFDWSEPLWRKALEVDGKDDSELRQFIERRLSLYDNGKKIQPMSIYSIGEMPDVEWQTKIASGNTYEVKSARPFFNTCSADGELVISSESWMKQFSNRYKNHPVMTYKAVARMPVGLAYGTTLAAAGVGLFAGCIYVAASAHANDAQICSNVFEVSAGLFNVAGRVTDYMVRPDLRRWRRVPMGFYFTESSQASKDKRQSKCISEWEWHNLENLPMIYSRSATSGAAQQL